MEEIQNDKISLEDLQKIKLKKEIEAINYQNQESCKKWYKKPQWIIALSPIIIGVFTLSVAWGSGFLQAQSTLNKVQIETFNSKRDSINKIILNLQKKSSALGLFVNKVKLKNANLNQQNINLKMLNDSLQKITSNKAKNKYVVEKYIQSENQKNVLISTFINYLFKTDPKESDKKETLDSLKVISGIKG